MNTWLRCVSLLAILLGLARIDATESESHKGAEQPPPASALPKLLDLGAEHCMPCKMMAPILTGLAEEFKGVFVVEFVDVSKPQNRELATRHGIRVIPTQIFLDSSGNELGRHEGFLSREDILNKWQDLGFHFQADPKRLGADGSQ